MNAGYRIWARDKGSACTLAIYSGSVIGDRLTESLDRIDIAVVIYKSHSGVDITRQHT